MIELLSGERIDEVNDRLKLIQKPEGLTFGTDALLLAGYIDTKKCEGLELGAGSGIISMLLLAREKLTRIKAIEIQEEYADLISRNAKLNGLSDALTPLCIDLRNFKDHGNYDTVFTNPPYMKADSGRANGNEKKNIARHEIAGGIADFTKCAASSLKFGGSFYAVYRPDRLSDLCAAMRESKLEPKRMTFVFADTESESSMVLVEARLGGKCGLMLTPPLIVYKDRAHREYTDDMKYIMEHGSFPEKYKRK